MTTPKVAKTIEELLVQMFQKADGGNCIYRGETKENGKISSKLYRELMEYVKAEHINIEGMQKTVLEDAKKHTKEENDDTILEQIQHFGGSTNQIDFTTDYLIALFFACDGEHGSNGKLIFLDKTKFKGQIHEPRHPQNRVIAQKSVFVRSSSGLIEVKSNETITIDKGLKISALHYLRQHHDISTHTIYNDIHGYITRSKIHKLARQNFYHGFMSHEAKDYKSAINYYEKALGYDPNFEHAYNNLGNVYNKMKKYNFAINNFNKAIALDSNYAIAYNNLGSVYNNMKKYNIAINNFNKAIDLNPMIVIAYVNRSIAKKALQDYKGEKEDLEKALQSAEQQEDGYIAAQIQKRINKLAEPK